MATIDGLRERRSVLEKRFASELSWTAGTADGIPGWFDSLLADLVIAIGDEEIRYLSADYSPTVGDSTGSMTLVLFTDELVIYASFDPDVQRSEQFEVVVTARKSLNSFSIDTVDGFDGNSTATDGMRITLMYPQFSRTLPLAKSDWPLRNDETIALLMHLRRDLVA